MLEPPGGQEIVGVVGLLPLVEIDDPPHAVLVAVGVGDHRVRREGEALGFQDEVFGDPPRRLQVLLQQGRRHRQRFRRVVEAGLVGGVDGELPRRADVDARQVADGVVVLGVAQPTRQDRAGIARVSLRLVLAERLDPVDDPSRARPPDAASPSPAASTRPRAAPGPLPSARGPWPPLPRSYKRSGPGRPSASPCRGTAGNRSRGTAGRSRGTALDRHDRGVRPSGPVPGVRPGADEGQHETARHCQE